MKHTSAILFSTWFFGALAFAAFFWSVTTWSIHDDASSHHIEGVVVYKSEPYIVVMENATGELYRINLQYYFITLDVGDSFNVSVSWDDMERLRR